MKKLKGWRLVLFSASGFGPNLLMTLLTAYLLDALVPAGIVKNLDKWSLSGTAAPLVAKAGASTTPVAVSVIVQYCIAITPGPPSTSR